MAWKTENTLSARDEFELVDNPGVVRFALRAVSFMALIGGLGIALWVFLAGGRPSSWILILVVGVGTFAVTFILASSTRKWQLRGGRELGEYSYEVNADVDTLRSNLATGDPRVYTPIKFHTGEGVGRATLHLFWPRDGEEVFYLVVTSPKTKKGSPPEIHEFRGKQYWEFKQAKEQGLGVPFEGPGK